MGSDLDGVFRCLSRRSSVSVSSDLGLAGEAWKAGGRIDERRAARAAENGKEITRPRRKPNLKVLPRGVTVRVAPWEILHVLARSMVLDAQGAARGLAEHWGSLKYARAFDATSDGRLRLSKEGLSIEGHNYKRLQSAELGNALALSLVRQYLDDTDRRVSIIPAVPVLRAGWGELAKNYSYRPDFLVELWNPGESSRFIPVAAKGNHSGHKAAYEQLARVSAHVEAMHIGRGDETPALAVSTVLSKEGPMRLYALRAEGAEGKVGGVGPTGSRSLGPPVAQKGFFPEIRDPAPENEEAAQAGYQILSREFSWLQNAVACLDAAGLATFAGDYEVAARYLPVKQAAAYSNRLSYGGIGTSRSIDHKKLLGIPFTGTEHVLRIGGVRVEAFSGVEVDLFTSLKEGRLDDYRSEVYSRRDSWPTETHDPDWGGPVSVQPDGSVFAIGRLS